MQEAQAVTMCRHSEGRERAPRRRKLTGPQEETLLGNGVEPGALANGHQHGAEVEEGLSEPGLGECLVTLDYWLLGSSFFVIMGAGFTLLNNMGESLS